MSYPGYPPYQQPGANPSYPPYPTGGAPYPTPGGGVYPPSLGFGTNAPMYMPQPSYPGYPGAGGSYPPQPQQQAAGSYPGAAIPQASYPGAAAPQASYPGAAAPQAPYPGAQQVYPQQTGGGYANTQSYAHQSYAPPPAQGGRSGEVVKKKTPTVVPAQPFDPRADAEILRKAMKGFGTDEKAIIQVLGHRTNAQRLEIAVQFKTMYGKDLIKDLKSELSGRLEDLIKAMMTPLPQYYAKELHDAIYGIGTDEDCLIEVLCTLSNHEIQVIRSAYQNTYGVSMESDLRGDTGGHFKRLMTSLCTAGRDESGIINQAQATADAQQLLQAGINQWGTDESVFNQILCSRNHNQLRLVFDEYQRCSGHNIEDAIKSEFSGDIQQGLLAVVRAVRNMPGFFAKCLHKSLAGMGTDDSRLIRIVVTRSEIDMGDIKLQYAAAYGKMLADAISSDTSGDYKKCLLALIGEY